MTKRIFILLMAAGCICGWCGCESVKDASLTHRLWAEGDFIVPSPAPKLVLSLTPHGVLVQYDAELERNGSIVRRAYYVEPNIARIAAGQKPVFVDPARAGAQTAIPILTRRPEGQAPSQLFALCSTNNCTFTVYRGNRILGPCDLPVYKGSGGMAKKLALTPLAVTGDASVVGALTSFIWVGFLDPYSGGAALNTDGTPSNF